MYGLDFRARPCAKESLVGKTYLYFVHPNIDIDFTMCVAVCPVSTGRDMTLYLPDGVTNHTGQNFKYSSIQTHQVGRYCIPVESELKSTVDKYIENFNQFFERSVGDIYYSMSNFLVGYLI